MQSAVVLEVERWPHLPASVASNPVVGLCLLQFADYNLEVFISQAKRSGLESTLGPSKSVLVYTLHSLEHNSQALLDIRV